MTETNDNRPLTIADAARRLHAFILLHFSEDGLIVSQIFSFYCEDLSAGSLIQKHGLMKIVKGNANLFRLNDDETIIYALPNNDKAIQSDRNRIKTISMQFYNEQLKGKALVMERCEDRSQFNLELNRWKDTQRLSHKGKRFYLRGVSPASVIRALRQMKVISIVDSQEGVIIWNKQN